MSPIVALLLALAAAVMGDLVSMVLREVRVRVSLRYEDSIYRRPPLYGQQLRSDDFWILAGRWDTYGAKIAPSRIHPLLGWTQGPLTADSPRGLLPETESRLRDDGRPKVLFLGDSYVEGHADPADWLPPLLERRLREQVGDVDVLHLGVGGYGTDQMHLMLREFGPEVGRPDLVIMGVMIHSFDRAGLRVRSYQKPRFDVAPDGELELTNVPIDRDPERYFQEADLSFRVYTAQMDRFSAEDCAASDDGFEEKVEVNRALIEANQRLCESMGAELLYVIFHNYHDLRAHGQRVRFFMEELATRGIPALDTAPILLEHVAKKGTDGSELYEDGHLVAEGNGVVMEAIAEKIGRLDLGRARTE